ncbi:MAG TPA: 2OG-Fe(II) oxygenase, partial [Myxococcaceae bacterium]
MAENDWTAALEATGHGVIRGLLGAAECAAIAALYDEPGRFRSRVVMAKHGFGRGEYQYFGHPLPARVLELRRALYPLLVPVANRWAEALGKPDRYPGGLEAYLERCHAAGQSREDVVPLEHGDAVAFTVNER